MKPLSFFTSCDLSKKDITIIISTVEQLVSMKLRNTSMISHSGIANTVISKDSSITIMDYPSGNWEYFEILRNRLKRRKC